MCPYKDGAKCTAPDTDCPNWQGTFCELDESSKRIKSVCVMKH